jgi:hypothetical protein
MDEKLYELGDLEIWKRGDRFFARYDAGAHQIIMREDEISAEEAKQAMKGGDAVNAVLLALEKRLLQAGLNPHVSNVNKA